MLCIVSTAAAQSPNGQRFVFRRGLMGTLFTLTFYAPDSLTAQQANAAVNARMDSLNQTMSDYLDGSEINRLSATSGSGQWVRVSSDLFNVLRKAQMIARLSNGRFDPTIGPLSQLWRRAVRRGTFPNAVARRKARRAVGYRLVELDSVNQSVRLRRAGMRLDVGGIGQGFAIDEAAKTLRSLDVNAFLIDLGGDVLAGDTVPWTATSGRGSNAGVTPGRSRPGYAVAIDSNRTILLQNAAVTTSGDVYRHLDYRGRRYSHVMNPRSGLGLRHFVRATVLAPDGWRADALTKVFSVAGWRKSRRLLRQFPGAELYILEKNPGRLRRWQSAGFP